MGTSYEKTTTYKKNVSFFDNIQYIIAIIISILFVFVMFGGKNQSFILIVLLLTQLIFSIINFRILHVIFEIILLALAALAIIPFIGFIFAFFGLFLALLDMAMFKDSGIYKQVKVRTFKEGDFKSKSKKTVKKRKMKDASNVQDAEFKEK